MECKPFKTNITVEAIFDFDLGNPSTYTGIPIVDAVLEAAYTVNPRTAKNVSDYLKVPLQKLSYTMEVCAGYNLAGILELQRIKMLREAIFENIDKPMDEIAHKAGFSGRSAAEKLMKNKKFSQYFADIDLKELRPKRYYKSKVGEKKSEYFH